LKKTPMKIAAEPPAKITKKPTPILTPALASKRLQDARGLA
jgi:hypothetical protein